MRGCLPRDPLCVCVCDSYKRRRAQLYPFERDCEYEPLAAALAELEVVDTARL